jgi:tetratricopeptide (TPR) repeat protein
MSAKWRRNNTSTASNSPATKAEQPAAAQRARPAISRRRKWAFRLAAMILVPVLFLGMLEAGLRLGGYGYPTAFMVGPDAEGVYMPNPQFGWRFFPHAIARKAEPFFITAKAPGVIRIFVLGSSAAQGIPIPSFGFGPVLESLLRDRHPGVKIEIVNVAMTAINSHVAVEIARDCAAHQPDLFVVYMGNNEVVGPYGPGTVFQQWSPSRRLIRGNIRLKSTRVGQLLDDAMSRLHFCGSSPTKWQGLEMFMGNPVAADDPRLPAVYDNYRHNLIDICGIARRAGAGVILSTVAVNLRDCPPFASQHRSDLSPEDLAKWESIYRAGVELEKKEKRQEAIGKYEAASRIDDRYAELQFRLGRCYAAQKRPAEARKRFVLACELDSLRFRADSRINAVIREAAAEGETSGVCGVDAEQAFAKSELSPDGVPGENLFYEHVHLTFDGNYLLARTVLEQVEAALPQLAASRKAGEPLSREQCAESLILTPWDEYQMLALMAEVVTRPPFNNQLDHDIRAASMRERSARLGKVAKTPHAQEAAYERYEAAMQKSPDNWDLQRRFGQIAAVNGRLAEATEHLKIVMKKMPWDAGTYITLGQIAQCGGKTDEAIDYFQKALKIDPGLAMAHHNLALALNDRGKYGEAIEHFQQTLEIDPGCVPARSCSGGCRGSCGPEQLPRHPPEQLRANRRGHCSISGNPETRSFKRECPQQPREDSEDAQRQSGEGEPLARISLHKGQINHSVPLLRRSSVGRNRLAGHCLCQAVAHCGGKCGLVLASPELTSVRGRFKRRS